MTHSSVERAMPPARPGRRRLLAALAAGLVLPLLAAPAQAHAILVASTPPQDGQVKAGAVTLHLRFNSRIDRARSRLVLVRPDKSQTTLAIGKDSTENVLVTTATLAAGAYTVRWQVLAVDGHITRGDLPFTVTAP